MATKKTTKSVGRTTKTFGDRAWAGLFASRTLARAFRDELIAWLKKNHPALVPKGAQ